MSRRSPTLPAPEKEEALADLLRVALWNWEDLPAESAAEEPPANSAAEHIGRYRLVEKIGEGGFGLVWRAWQTAPIQRQTALKIIKAGVDSGQVMARFNAERQTLAMMDHPGIASVYDAGTTEGGLPYFVMELVDGPPLNTYCDRRRLDVPARLRLFIQVCRAVQHAHQKGVLHRDLKPGNILVAEVDGRPQPKIIDFGISRALDTTTLPQAARFLTRCDLLLGTPDYMSPEQAILGNPDLDTRADIYSLGAILYELLTGLTPLRQDSAAGAPLDEVLQSVRRDEARRPSAVAISPEAARSRAASPAELAQRLRGDLDWILLKALAKNRDDRYESADALALDLEHHLGDLPISAGRPTLAQGARKFVRRHRALTGSLAAVTLALLTGVTMATLAYLRESEAREKADLMRQRAESHEAEAMRQRDLALRESRKASQTLAFLNRLLEDTGALAVEGKNPEALRLALDGLIGEIETFSDDPEVREAITKRAAMIYRALRDDGKVLPLVASQIRLLERERPANDPELLTARESYARSLYLSGRIEESHEQYDLAIAGWRSLLDTRDGPRRLFLARRNRVDVWSKTGRLAEALEEFADIRAQATEEIRGHSSWPVFLRSHAEALTAARRWKQAGDVYEEALATLDVRRPEHQHHASTLHSKRATLYLKQGNVTAAISALERAIELQTQAKGALSPWLPPWWIEVSRLYAARDEPDKAVAACQAALDNAKKTGQIGHLNNARRALGDNFEAAGRHREAAASYLAAAELAMQTLPPPAEAWLDRARAMRNLARDGQTTEAALMAAPLEKTLASWRGDSGRAYDIQQVELALAYTHLARAEAGGPPAPDSLRQIGAKFGRPLIANFKKRRNGQAQSPAIREALALLAQQAEEPFAAAVLSAADVWAFDTAINDRWKSGDHAAQLIELAGALRVTGRHRTAAAVYQIAAQVIQPGLPVKSRRQHALRLAEETLRQTEGDVMVSRE